MVVTCETCRAQFDDQFRSTICPHETFLANDGANNFAHHPESVLIPTEGAAPLPTTAAIAAALTPEQIRRLGAFSLQEEHSAAVEQLITTQEQTYRDIFRTQGVEPLIEALLARDRQLAQDGRVMADGRMAGRVLREFVRGALAKADARDLQVAEKTLVEVLGAEPADARQLKLHGTTLGTDVDLAERAEQLADGRRKQ